MRTITLIYDGTFNTYRWLKAMMWARNEFHDLGYKIKYASIFDYVPYPKSRGLGDVYKRQVGYNRSF